LLRVLELLGGTRLRKILDLAFLELFEFGLGVLHLADQSRKLALATILDRVHEILELLSLLFLTRSRSTHLVLGELVGGLTHFRRGLLLAGLGGGLGQRGGGKRIGLGRSLRHLVHLLQNVLQAASDV